MVLGLFIFVSFFSCSLFPAASSAEPEAVLPYDGRIVDIYAKDEEMFEAFRNNDIEYIDSHLTSELATTSFSGGNTLFHVAASMEHFHNINPQAIIDILFRVMPRNPNSDLVRRSDIAIPERLINDARPFYSVGDVSDPALHYMCTGKRIGRPPRILHLSPIELAIEYKSLQTITAIMKKISSLDRPFLPLPIFSKLTTTEPFSSNISLFEDIVIINSQGQNEMLSKLIVHHLIKQFGLKGIRMLHKLKFQINKNICIPENLFCREADALSPLELLSIYHPNAKHEINDIIEDIRPKGFIESVKKWFSTPIESKL